MSDQQTSPPSVDTSHDHLRLGFHGRVIDHLGIQMYQSPVAAVAEVVSNSWDAEAEHVNIDLPKDLSSTAEIVVKDDGFGMTFQQCQDRFLEVGFDKRGSDPKKKSPKKQRTVLGRKGIGKFAGFGIAEVIQVATISQETGEKTVFKLDVTKLRGNEYIGRDSKEIEVVSYGGPDEQRKSEHGTTITLQRLSIAQRPSPLVFGKSMARRFLLHQRFGDFSVLVDGEPLPEAEDQQKIEFIFPRDYSADELPEGIVIHSDGSGTEKLSNGQSIRWRFAFYGSPIDEEELQGVAVFANSKLAQTPFLFNLVGGLGGQQGVEYLSGTVEADYLDELPVDIIAPERQRIDWVHSESLPLITWGQARVKSLLRLWVTHRAQQRLAILKGKIQPFAPRLEKLPRHDREIIYRALTKIAEIPTIKEATFIDLSLSLLTAWEGGRLKELILTVSEVDDMSAPDFLDVLMEAKVLTALHTAEAVKSKLLIIQGLEERIKTRELELAVRDYIAENPWLVSPKWETFQVERSITHVVEAAAQEAKLDKEEDWKKRIDLVLSSGDTLLILEFMQPGLKVDSDHIYRFNLYITAVRTRVEANSAGQFQRVTGYIIADKLNSTPTNAALLKQFEQQGMYAMEWEMLLRQAEAQWKDFLDLLALRAPEDDRVKQLTKPVNSAAVSTPPPPSQV